MTAADRNRSFAARAKKLDASAISDALDRMGINGQCYRIAASDRRFDMAGHAYTVLYRPRGHGEDGYVGDFIDDVPPGSVVVIDNGGRDDVTTWGDILTEVAHHRGVAGTVIDGISRDIALSGELNYPIFSRGHWMRTGKNRIQIAGVQVPVTIGGVTVRPGDLVRGDADGVVVVPHEVQDELLTIAEAISVAQQGIRDAYRSGRSLVEARKLHRYRDLQSPDFDAGAQTSGG